MMAEQFEYEEEFEEEEDEEPSVRIIGSPATWEEDLPPNHGKWLVIQILTAKVLSKPKTGA